MSNQNEKKNDEEPALIWDLMSDHNQKHKVVETRMRSLLKGLTARILEITLDTFVLSFFVKVEVGLGVSIFLETTCYVVSYLNERGWNKIQWQRKVIHIESDHKT